MLDVTGDGSTKTCDGLTRRDFLQVGTLGALGFSLSQLAALEAQGAVKNDQRSAIMIFNLGAPSQLDTWDMKPDAPREIRGPFKPIRTRSPEIQISEIFPRHAKIADKFSLVRTCYHTAAAVHDTGHQMMADGTTVQRRDQHAPRGLRPQLPAGPSHRPSGTRRPPPHHGEHRRQPAPWSGRRVSRQGPRPVHARFRSFEVRLRSS